MNLWVVMLLAGAGTFAVRAAFLFVPGGSPPAPLRDALRFVTPAALTAIMLPVILYPGGGSFDAGIDNERVPAALIAVVIARVTANVWLTIGGGMAALWTLSAIT